MQGILTEADQDDGGDAELWAKFDKVAGAIAAYNATNPHEAGAQILIFLDELDRTGSIGDHGCVAQLKQAARRACAVLVKQTDHSAPSTTTLLALIDKALITLARVNALNPDTQWEDISGLMDDFHQLVNDIAQRVPETDADAMAQIGFFIAELERADIADMSESVKQLLDTAKRAAKWLAQQQAGSSGASTTIPALGITIAEAAAKLAQLVAEHDTLDDGDDATEDLRDDLFDARERLEKALLAAEPKTLADVVALLDRLLCPSVGLPISAGVEKEELDALRAIRALLAGMVGATATADAGQQNVSESDPFAAVRDAFKAESTSLLEVPQAPTAAMTAKATAAAGISAEQFATAYAVAVEAFQQERAAA